MIWQAQSAVAVMYITMSMVNRQLETHRAKQYINKKEIQLFKNGLCGCSLVFNFHLPINGGLLARRFHILLFSVSVALSKYPIFSIKIDSTLGCGKRNVPFFKFCWALFRIFTFGNIYCTLASQFFKYYYS